jgi:hypothetical protein
VQQDKYAILDELGSPNRFVEPLTSENLGYITYFRQVCQRYNIDFASADPDERDFVIHMTEKGFYSRRA